MSVIIEKKALNSVIQISSFRVQISNTVLHSSCDLIVSLYDDDYKMLRQDVLKLEGDDYLNWGVDDDYIVDYVKNHYGFVVTQPDPEPIE